MSGGDWVVLWLVLPAAGLEWIVLVGYLHRSAGVLGRLLGGGGGGVHGLLW